MIFINENTVAQLNHDKNNYNKRKNIFFSLVDGLTGNYLEKTNPSRRVTSYYEGLK